MKAICRFMGLGLACGFAGVVLSTDASAQAGTVCFPGSDLLCSPKVEVGTTKSSASKVGLVLKRDNLPFNQSDIEVIAFALDQSGTCGSNGAACPSKSYNVGVNFTGQAASVTANVRGGVLARSSDKGNACASLFLDVFRKNGTQEEKVASKLVGVSCEQSHQSLFNSIPLTNLEAGKSYVLRGRLECRYSNIPQASTGTGAGHFLCSTHGTEVTLIWPFGRK